MKKNSPKVILIIGYRILNWLYFYIIPILRQRYGTIFVVISGEATRKDFEKVLDKTNDKFIALDENFNNQVLEGFGKNIYQEEKLAREIEEKYNINYMRDIIQQDRSLSAYFLSYAKKFIWNKRKISNNQSYIKYINGYVKFVENLIDSYDFDIALVFPVNAISATVANILEAKNVLVTYPYNSKYKSYAYWANNAFQSNERLKSSFINLENETSILDEDDEITPPETGWGDTRDMDKLYTYKALFKNIFKLTFFRLEFIFYDLIKFNFKKSNRISFLSNITFEINKFATYKSFNKISERNIEKIGDKPFIFYALSLEPEFSVQGRSKEFNDQKTIIKQIAINLPSGCELVIKEHSDIGRRDIDFYKEILLLPNVRMAHPSIRGVDLVKKASAVATLAGTVSFEATMMGKKVIEFSLHSSFSFLENIYTVSDFSKLGDVLKIVMKNPKKDEIDRIKLNGHKLKKAIKNISFLAENSPLFYGNKTDIDSNIIDRSIDLLLELYMEENI